MLAERTGLCRVGKRVCGREGRGGAELARDEAEVEKALLGMVDTGRICRIMLMIMLQKKLNQVKYPVGSKVGSRKMTVRLKTISTVILHIFNRYRRKVLEHVFSN